MDRFDHIYSIYRTTTGKVMPTLHCMTGLLLVCLHLPCAWSCLANSHPS